MPKCNQCNELLHDGASCSSCNGDFHFHCGGITESGYRRLGDRKTTWRCPNCKLAASKSTTRASSPALSAVSNDQILQEVKALSLKLAPLDNLIIDVKSLKDDLASLKTEIKISNKAMKEFGNKIKAFEDRISSLEKAKDSISALQVKVESFENDLHANDQWSRMNNIELKGIPVTKNENLYEIIATLGKKVNYPIEKTLINYVARIPTRDPNKIKPIIACFNNRYAKEDFVAAARAATSSAAITPSDVGLHGRQKIFVNDHLTPQNKGLLSKAKDLAKERDFQYVWVKHCKIMARKNTTSPVINIKTEKDLLKIL